MNSNFENICLTNIILSFGGNYISEIMILRSWDLFTQEATRCGKPQYTYMFVMFSFC